MCNTVLGGSHCAALLFLKSAANTLNVTFNTVGLNGLCFVDKLHPHPNRPILDHMVLTASVHCVITAIYTLSIKYKFRLMI